MNIAELANQLTREKIFISSERQLLQNLNEELEKSALELLQAAWICSQQRQNLTDLMNARCEPESIAACQRASQLEGTTFIDVYKVLKYKVGFFILFLFLKFNFAKALQRHKQTDIFLQKAIKLLCSMI